MADARSASDDQCRLLGVPRSKREAALSVDQHVIADDEIASTLHPVDKNVCSNVAAVAAAVPLEQRLRNKHAKEPVVHSAHQQKDSEKKS